jgi:hypothetical protein
MSDTNIDKCCDIVAFKMFQWTSGGLYIVYVSYISAQYLIDVANISTSPTLDIHYLI